MLGRGLKKSCSQRRETFLSRLETLFHFFSSFWLHSNSNLPTRFRLGRSSRLVDNEEISLRFTRSSHRSIKFVRVFREIFFGTDFQIWPTRQARGTKFVSSRRLVCAWWKSATIDTFDSIQLYAPAGKIVKTVGRISATLAALTNRSSLTC